VGDEQGETQGVLSLIWEEKSGGGALFFQKIT
jgi:hypothetical protein